MFNFPKASSIPEEDEALRPAIRAFIQENLPDTSAATKCRSWMGFDADFSRKLGAAGWLGMTLPAAYGGRDKSLFARFVVVEELLSSGAPVSAHWVAERQSAPLILRFGTEEQRQFFLPRICAGEAFFCIGMSEPGSGSDLASVRSNSQRTDEGWVLNGSKIWTTYAHHAHYMIALMRTAGTPADRQKGLSQFIVDLSLPGISIRPIEDLAGDEHFCEVHFDNVLLPESALVGSEGEGWKQCMSELALERSGPERIYSSNVLLDLWLREAGAAETQDPDVHLMAGKMIGRLAMLRQFSIAVTNALVEGSHPDIAAALLKDLGTTFEQSVPNHIGQWMAGQNGPAGSSALMDAYSYLAGMAPAFSLRGGTREVLRGMIARSLELR